MQAFIGVDGGGTKTALVLTDDKGNVLNESVIGTVSCRALGLETAVTLLVDAVDRLLDAVNVSRAEVAAAVFGLSAYGEDIETDSSLRDRLVKDLLPIPLTLVNDVVVGFYGAIGNGPGIEIVAGTGSIAYGQDVSGRHARSGGWSEHFSDEGSCYWSAKQAMSLFCREADGRAPRGALYGLVREMYGITDDFSFIAIMEQQLIPDRGKTADFQRVLLQAAHAGDAEAIKVYEKAADELCCMADAVRRTLDMTGPVPVSITGGMTHAEGFLTKPLSRRLHDKGMQLVSPRTAPVMGAALLARLKNTHK